MGFFLLQSTRNSLPTSFRALSPFLPWAPGANGLPEALHTAHVALTRRSNGGYTLAISGRARVDPTPQQFKFSQQNFLPMFFRRWRSLAPGGFEGWRQGHETRGEMGT